MKTYIALLRAVNVGGTGKLPMADLRQMCADLGFEKVQTYIQSGNVVFRFDKDALAIKQMLEEKISQYLQKPSCVIIRTTEELKSALASNPYKSSAPNRVIISFCDSVPNLDGIKYQKCEEIQIIEREIFVHYGDGMAQSKLVIPASKNGTARNINTLNKLVEMAQSYE